MEAAVIIAAAALLFLPWGKIGPALLSAAKRLAPKLPSCNPLTVKVELPLWKVAVLVGLFWSVSGGGLPDWKLPGWNLPAFVTKASEATYVWDKSQGGVPPAVMSGLNKLNTERNILATQFEQPDSGNIPDQYAVAFEAAKKNGLPSLVALAGQRVLKVTKDPRTEEAVLGGVP